MTQKEINQLMRPFLKREERKRMNKTLVTVGLIALGALYVALLITLVAWVMA